METKHKNLHLEKESITKEHPWYVTDDGMYRVKT